MYKLVQESLNEFQKGLDPVDSLGLGRRKLIEDWLKSMSIHVYKINDDYTIDTDRHIRLRSENLQQLPEFIQFNHTRSFDIEYNNLTSLRGCPKIVDAWFSCANNQLKTLEGAPKIVKGDFDCSFNKLISLKGSPTKVTNFHCTDNIVQFTKEEIRKVCNVIGGILS